MKKSASGLISTCGLFTFRDRNVGRCVFAAALWLTAAHLDGRTVSPLQGGPQRQGLKACSPARFSAGVLVAEGARPPVGTPPPASPKGSKAAGRTYTCPRSGCRNCIRFVRKNKMPRNRARHSIRGAILATEGGDENGYFQSGEIPP